MKKFLLLFCIFLIVLLILWIVYTSITAKIVLNINNANIIAVSIETAGSDGLYTKENSEILEVIKHLNSICYYKSSNLKIYNTTPDARVTFLDKDGKIIDQIKFYGYVAVYKDKKYGMLPFTYSRIEKLCKKLNKQQ